MEPMSASCCNEQGMTAGCSPYMRSRLSVVPSRALRLTAAECLLSARAAAMKSSTLCTLISDSSKSVSTSSEPITCRWFLNLSSVKALAAKCTISVFTLPAAALTKLVSTSSAPITCR